MGEHQFLKFPTRSDTNWPVEAYKMASGLKFWILEVDLCGENKDIAVTAQLIWVFAFT